MWCPNLGKLLLKMKKTYKDNKKIQYNPKLKDVIKFYFRLL